MSPTSSPPNDSLTLVERTRLERSISRKKLAEQSGVAEATLHDIENLNRRPADKTLIALAPILGFSVPQLRVDFNVRLAAKQASEAEATA